MYWEILAKKSKQRCQGITAAPAWLWPPVSTGGICHSIFWCCARTAESSQELKGLSHKQQHPSKRREPDFPEGHQEGRLCIRGRQRGGVYGLRSTSVGKSNTTDTCTSSSVWNDLLMALPEQQKHALPPAGMLFSASCCKATVQLHLNLARLQTKTYHSFQDVSRPLLNNSPLLFPQV